MEQVIDDETSADLDDVESGMKRVIEVEIFFDSDDADVFPEMEQVHVQTSFDGLVVRGHVANGPKTLNP